MKPLRTSEGKRLLDSVGREHGSPESLTRLGEWLVTKKAPFGDFILEQLAATHGDPKPTFRGGLALRHYEEWLGPLAEVVDPFSVRFRGGFLRAFVLGDERHGHVDARWIGLLKDAVDAPQLLLVEKVGLGRDVGLGAAQPRDGDGGAFMAVETSQKGRRIPIVAFLSCPMMKHLAEVTYPDELAQNVETGLRRVLPNVKLTRLSRFSG